MTKTKKPKQLTMFAVGFLTFALLAPMVPLSAMAATGPDTIAPVVQLTAPANGATVLGTVSISASSTDARYSPTCPVRIFGQNFDVTPLLPPPSAGGHTGGNVFTCYGNADAMYAAQHGTSLSPRMDPYLMKVSKVEFYVDGVLKGTDTASSTAFAWNLVSAFAWDTTTATNGSHTLQAKAYDLANNVGVSSVVTVTVSNAAPTPDTTVPTTPATLSATPVSTSQINLAWTASTDNVAVTGYNVFRGGVKVGTSTGSTYSDTGLTASTTYSYYVQAYDAAGNVSGTSTSVSATTLATNPTSTASIAITAPLNNATPTGTLLITSSVTGAVKKVELWINGAYSTFSQNAPYSFAWDLTKAYNGSYNLQTKSYDVNGALIASSQIVKITVTGGVVFNGGNNGNGGGSTGNTNNGNHNGEKKALEKKYEAEKKALEKQYEQEKKAREQEKERAKHVSKKIEHDDDEESDD